MFAVKQTVAPYRYRIYERGRWGWCRFTGAEDILSVHATEQEADAVIANLQAASNEKLSDGCLRIHEGEYMRYQYMQLTVIPVDVTPVVIGDGQPIAQD